MRYRVASLLLLALLLPKTAFAAFGTEVTTEAELAEALVNGEKNIVFAADIVTFSNMTVPGNVVIDAGDHVWTVNGTVELLGTVEKGVSGRLFAGKGTIRKPTTVALENAKAGEVVKSVTYIDESTGKIYGSGEPIPEALVDGAAGYIAGCAAAADGTVRLSLKTNKAATVVLRVQRVVTSQGTYRFGTADRDNPRLSLTYAITYDLAGGMLADGTNPTEYTMSDGAIALANPTREGYVFLGWSGTGLPEPTQSAVIPAQSSGNRSYVANWEESKRPQGGSMGGGRGNSGDSSGTMSTVQTQQTEETEAVPQTAEQGTQQGPAASVRVSAASSSVETKFYGSRLTLQRAAEEETQSRIELPRLLCGVGLLLCALAGGLLLWKRRR